MSKIPTEMKNPSVMHWTVNYRCCHVFRLDIGSKSIGSRRDDRIDTSSGLTAFAARTSREDVQAQQKTRPKVAFITCNCSACNQFTQPISRHGLCLDVSLKLVQQLCKVFSSDRQVTIPCLGSRVYRDHNAKLMQ
ncbi:hypothetical protein PsorP6_011530 [Peronosclerospora sorghi]|uniref:Uncharacterized protein n=1 Tax=Peronosclerospora sorghi TaxID=230839 RepID=A0ACC0WJU6_9STRA|nr:hypothetical protein PsorP6_011530 [Peronosclerospora sorghi]